MESNGEPGKINISAVTHELIKDHFETEYRGKLEAKGKGQIDMHFVGDDKGTFEPQDKAAVIEEIKDHVLSRLNNELADNLYYHGPHHTVDVYESAKNLGEKEKISDDDMELLEIAALFHDSGFMVKYADHEEVGCKIARATLPDYGYTVKQIDIICDIIMATKLPQLPKTHLQEIICDADLDYLGRDDFEQISGTLVQEMDAFGKGVNKDQWNTIQINFLGQHKYFTETSQVIREPVKQQHLAKIKDHVNQGK